MICIGFGNENKSIKKLRMRYGARGLVSNSTREKMYCRNR